MARSIYGRVMQQTTVIYITHTSAAILVNAATKENHLRFEVFGRFPASSIILELVAVNTALFSPNSISIRAYKTKNENLLRLSLRGLFRYPPLRYIWSYHVIAI